MHEASAYAGTVTQAYMETDTLATVLRTETRAGGSVSVSLENMLVNAYG